MPRRKASADNPVRLCSWGGLGSGFWTTSVIGGV